MSTPKTNKTTASANFEDPAERLMKIRQRAEADAVQGDFLEGPRIQSAKTPSSPLPANKSLLTTKHLPMWADSERAGPNVLMRSSIFGIAPPRSKRWVSVASQPREVVALGDIQISMIGEELRQEDGDVLFGVLHLARISSRHGGVVEFTASDFIRELGWNRDGNTYKRLHEIIRRLASTTIIVNGKNISSDQIAERGFTLVQYDFLRDDEKRFTGKWRVYLAASTVNLFWVGHYSRIHWDLHKELRSPLARYLHLLYATYKGPLSFGLDQLHALCGSQQKSMSAYRQTLTRAQEELYDVGILERWGWTDKKRQRLRVEMRTIKDLHIKAQQKFDFATVDNDLNQKEGVDERLAETI